MRAAPVTCAIHARQTRRPRRRRRRRRTRTGPAAAAPTSARADGATPRRRPGRRPVGRAPAAAWRSPRRRRPPPSPSPSRSSRRSVWGKSEPTVRRHGSRAGPVGERAGAVRGQRLDVLGQHPLRPASRRSRSGHRVAARDAGAASSPGRVRRSTPARRCIAGDMRAPLLLVGVEQRARARRRGRRRASTRGWPRPARRDENPWPANGGMRWAASPASRTRPRRQRARHPRVERVDDRALDLGVLAVEPLARRCAGRRPGRGGARRPRPRAASTPSGGGRATSAA